MDGGDTEVGDGIDRLLSAVASTDEVAERLCATGGTAVGITAALAATVVAGWMTGVEFGGGGRVLPTAVTKG